MDQRKDELGKGHNRRRNQKTREKNPGQDNSNRNNGFGRILQRRRRRGNGRSLRMSTLQSYHRSRRRFRIERLPSLLLLSFQTREARQSYRRKVRRRGYPIVGTS